MANTFMQSEAGGTDEKNKATTGSYGVRDLDADVASGPDKQTGYVNIDAIRADDDLGSEPTGGENIDPNATVSQVGERLQFNREFTTSNLISGTGDPVFDSKKTASGDDGGSSGGTTTTTDSGGDIFAFFTSDGSGGGGGGGSDEKATTVPGMGGGMTQQIIVGVIASIGAFLVLDAAGKKE